MSWLQDVAPTLLSSLGATGLAWLAFQWLGKRWLESQFAERLERFKHVQNEEIERLRFRINALMDRTTKLHQHEFEVLPKVWDLLGNATAIALGFTSRFQRFPDLGSMHEPMFLGFLARLEFEPWQIDELQSSKVGDRDAKYQDMDFWRALGDATNAHAELQNYFHANGIFIQPEIKAKILSMSKMIKAALIERQDDKYNQILGEGRFEKGDFLQRNAESGLEDIERSVQLRLWEANSI